MTFKLFGFPILIMSVLDQGYSRNVLCILNSIYMFLFQDPVFDCCFIYFWWCQISLINWVSLIFEFMILILTHNFSCCIVVSWYTNFCGFMLPTKTHENLLTLQVYHGWRGLLFDINSDCRRISHITGNGFIKTYVVNRKSAIKDWKVLLNILKSDWRLKKKCCERLKWVVKRLNKSVVKDWKKVLCKIDKCC